MTTKQAKTMTTVVLWVVLAVLLPGCAGGGGPEAITYEVHQQVELGMTLDQVEGILGQPGALGADGTWRWPGADGAEVAGRWDETGGLVWWAWYAGSETEVRCAAH